MPKLPIHKLHTYNYKPIFLIETALIKDCSSCFITPMIIIQLRILTYTPNAKLEARKTNTNKNTPPILTCFVKSLANTIDVSCYHIIRILTMIQNNNNYDYLFKYIIVGDSSVGKSCVLLRYTQSHFKKEHEPTLGVEFASKIVEINNLIIKTQIWDTAGQQSFKAITRSYYKGSIGTFLVFDITSRQSFENLHKWLYEIKNHSHDKVQICLLGNKVDMKHKRQVTYEQAQHFAKSNNFNYYEVSALSGEKVAEAFRHMSEVVLQKIMNKQLNTDGETSLGVRKGKMQKKEIITQVNSGFQLNNSNEKSGTCCK